MQYQGLTTTGWVQHVTNINISDFHWYPGTIGRYAYLQDAIFRFLPGTIFRFLPDSSFGLKMALGTIFRFFPDSIFLSLPGMHTIFRFLPDSSFGLEIVLGTIFRFLPDSIFRFLFRARLNFSLGMIPGHLAPGYEGTYCGIRGNTRIHHLSKK